MTHLIRIQPKVFASRAKQLLQLIALVVMINESAFGQTFTVTNNSVTDTWQAACGNPTALTSGTFVEGIRQANQGLITDIVFSGPMTIDLTPRSSTVELCANGVTITGSPGVVIQCTSNWLDCFTISGDNNILQDITFNGSIIINGGSGNLIDNISMTYSNNNLQSIDGIEITNNSDNNTVSNCVLNYSAATGSNRHAIFIEDFSDDNTVDNCQIDGFLNGVFIGTDPSAPSPNPVFNNIVQNSTITNALNMGIYVLGNTPRNTQLLNNDISNSTYSNIFFSGNASASGNIAKGNICHSSGHGIAVLDASGIEIDSNSCHSNNLNGINIEGSNNSLITRNIIGSDFTETADLGNLGNGIEIRTGTGHIIGGIDLGNVIVYNGNADQGGVTNGTARGFGITFFDGVRNSQILGNVVGTNRAGTSTSGGNFLSGINIERNTATSLDDNNVIGGLTDGEENLVGNNGFASAINASIAERSGIQIWSSNANTILGNFIGTNGAGSLIANNYDGITLNGSYRNTIGGGTLTASNIIAGSVNGIGLRTNFNGRESDDNIIQGNVIGTDLLGTSGLGASSAGISIEGGSNNVIGGTASILEGNAIVGSGGPGIFLQANWNATVNPSNNEIYNNQIGNVTGSDPNFENNGNGILINAGSNNIIGAIGSPNVIANKLASNAAIQVEGASTDNNTIVGNSTFCNAGRGIELNNTGNNNFASSGSGASAELYVNSATGPNWEGIAPANATIHVYEMNVCNACSNVDGGTQQGETYLGTTTADASGNWSYTSASSIVVTATDANGNTSEFSQCVTVCTAPPSASISPASTQQICQGESVTLTASPSGYYYYWYNGSTEVQSGTTETYVASTSGDYTVVVADPSDPTNVTCQVTSSATTVTVNPLPDPGSITGNDNVCDGYTESYMSTVTGVTYDWSTTSGSLASANGSQTIDIDYSGASNGTITLEVTDGNSCSATTTLDITVNATPNTTGIAGVDDVCEGTTGEIFTASSDFGTSYSWTVSGDATFVTGPGADQITVDFGTTDPITITAVASAGGCTDLTEASKSVNVNANPTTPVINGTTPVACNTGGYNFAVATDNSGSGATYQWTGPAGSTVNSPTSPSTTIDFGTSSGSVTVVETSAAGCESGTATFAVTVTGCGLEANFSVSSDSVCEGGTITFTDQSSSTSGTIDTWDWDFGTGANPPTATGVGPHTVTYSTAGTPTVSLTVTEGVASDDTVATSVITVNPVPSSPGTITGSSVVCENETGVQYDLAPSNASSTYTWTSPGTIQPGGNIGPGNDQIFVDFGTSGGQVTVFETTVSGCESPVATFDVTIDGPPTITGPIDVPSGVICDAASGSTYDFSVAAVDDEDLITWTVPAGANIVSGQGTESITVDFGTLSGNQTISIEASNTCGTDDLTSSTFSITESENPQVFIDGGDDPVCGNTSITFDALINFTDAGATFVWYIDGVAQAGQTSDQFILSAPVDGQQVTVEVIPSLSCLTKASDTSSATTVSVLPTPFAEAGPDQTLTDLEEIELSTDEYQTSTATGVTYAWTSSIDNGEIDNPNPATLLEEVTANPTADVTTYYLLVDNGTCTDLDSMQVFIDFLVWIPSGFSPNNDDNNDFFQIHNIDKYPGNRVEVYNRWGSLVYEADDYGVNGGPLWDGTHNGQDLPMATYYYIVTLNDESGQQLAGPVTIIK